MLGLFKTMFGSSSVIKDGINLIDDLSLTDEEKEKLKIEKLKAYEPFKLAQRLIGVSFTMVFLLTFIFCVILMSFGLEYQVEKIIELGKSFDIGMIMLAIISFYFGGGTISSYFSGKGLLNTKEKGK